MDCALGCILSALRGFCSYRVIGSAKISETSSSITFATDLPFPSQVSRSLADSSCSWRALSDEES